MDNLDDLYLKFRFIGPAPARKETIVMLRGAPGLTQPEQLVKLLEAEQRINAVIDGRVHISLEKR